MPEYDDGKTILEWLVSTSEVCGDDQDNSNRRNGDGRFDYGVGGAGTGWRGEGVSPRQVHLGDSIFNWAGFRVHVQKIDGSTAAGTAVPLGTVRFAGGGLTGTSGLRVTNWITVVTTPTVIGDSGRLLEASNNLVLTVRGPLSQWDTAMFTLYAITHVVRGERALQPSEWLFFGPDPQAATPLQ